MIQYLTKSTVEKIRESLRLEDIELSYNYEGGLKLTLDMVQTLYQDDIIGKAYYLLKEMIVGYYFKGGNKRTALLSTRVFLNINDYGLKYENGEGFLLTMMINYNLLTEEQIKDWLKKHIVERNEVLRRSN